MDIGIQRLSQNLDKKIAHISICAIFYRTDAECTVVQLAELKYINVLLQVHRKSGQAF